MARTYRHELKFLCAEEDLFHMENKIRHICRPDPNGGASGLYTVSSLYFDTIDDRCLSENLAGTDNRKKYRIRTYNHQTDEIRLECKYSRRGMKAKDSCRITKAACERLMRGMSPGIFPDETSQSPGRPRETEESPELLRRFLAERSMELLSPKIIVEYSRTAYLFPAGNVRITFDRAIRSSPRTASFPEKACAMRTLLPPGMQILEVKYDEMLPGAILELLAKGQNLRRISFSKYALCRQSCPC